MRKFRDNLKKGMSLVEITIVLVVLLVIFGAVFLFFSRGSEEFDFARRQNELITIGRMAIEEITDIVIYAGFMPSPHWGNDEWHPVANTGVYKLAFYADYEGDGILSDEDHRVIEVLDERFVVSDSGSYSHAFGSNIKTMNFTYLDDTAAIMLQPINDADRDLVRHIRIDVVLYDEYKGTEYTTLVTTTISPRNLGINHNIDPAFAPPDPLKGTVVFNVTGVGDDPLPDVDEKKMLELMVDWGLSVTILTDDSMLTYDYIGEEIDLIVLRHRPFGEVYPHPNFNYVPDTLHIPIITLNAEDATLIFGMGSDPDESSSPWMDPIWSHPVNRDLTTGLEPFEVYESAATQSVIKTPAYPTSGDTILTLAGAAGDFYSGVIARDEKTDKRRVHFSAWQASVYSAPNGERMFYNVLKWNVGDPETALGDAIIDEGFEDPNEYIWTDPGIGAEFYSYLQTPEISITTIPPGFDEARLLFDHCYVTDGKNAGAYLEICTDTNTFPLVWTQIPDDELITDKYDDSSNAAYPGGNGIEIWTGQSDGYNLGPPTPSIDYTAEEVDLTNYLDKTVMFRWVFGLKSKSATKPDWYVMDNPRVVHINTTTLDTETIDPWNLDPANLSIQPRFWEHDTLPNPGGVSFKDGFCYHNCHFVDDVYPLEWDCAWTTWGARHYDGGWSHDGVNDSWEIGETAADVFCPEIDPYP
ncbi:hypothetical protein DRQ25_18385, partial [Candidatus Fermentibacteria bacterium]